MDYYRMLAVLEPLKRPQEGRKELDRVVGTEAELALNYKDQARVDRATAAIRKELDGLRQTSRTRLFAQKKATLPAAEVAAFEAEPGKRTTEQKKVMQKLLESLDKEVN